MNKCTASFAAAALFSMVEPLFSRSNSVVGFTIGNDNGAQPQISIGASTESEEAPNLQEINRDYLLDPGTYRISVFIRCNSNGTRPFSDAALGILNMTVKFDKPYEVLPFHLSTYQGDPSGVESTPSIPFEHSVNFQREPSMDALYTLFGFYRAENESQSLIFSGRLESAAHLGYFDTSGTGGQYTTEAKVILNQPTTVTLSGRVQVGLRGEDQNLPLIGIGRRFRSAPSGLWFDPPMASGYSFKMAGDSKFTKILNFPVGIDSDNSFKVWVGTQLLGTFTTGQSVDFAALTGQAVPEFRVTGISPTVDSENPEAFPIQLAFSPEPASFDMTPILPPSIEVKYTGDTQAEITFDGDLEELLESGTWQKVTGAVSPYKIDIDSAVRSKFFRASKAE